MTERPYGEILDEMDHEAKYLPADDILQEAITTMQHARIFIASREKMHPTGIQLYDELLEKLIARRHPGPEQRGKDMSYYDVPRGNTYNVPENDLLPCPFCGGKASYDRMGTARQSCIISCDSCACTLETGEVWSCGQTWNKRHPGAGQETR